MGQPIRKSSNKLRLIAFAAAALSTALGTAPVSAQAYQCRIPQSVAVPKVASAEKPRRLPVTGYMLSASWSPEFCKGREMEARHRMQCSGRNGRFGFVAHGLWPDGRGAWPQYCSTQRTVSAAEARKNMCMMPSARLIASQWTKHGSCMSQRPETYFKITRILWDSIVWPETDRLSREDGLTAGMLRDAFIQTNPAWPREAIGIDINQRGWLQELRLCYSKKFMPTACDGRRFGPRDNTKIKIWRGL